MVIIRQLKNLFLFIGLLYFSKENIITENILLKDEQIIKQNLTKNKYYYIELNNQYSFPDYMKIAIKPEEIKEIDYINFINYAISYYQNDSSFKSRKQFSFTAFNETKIWLNKEQINKGFYLSTECFITPCEYAFEISFNDYILLSFGQQYSYFVTKENKELKFIINHVDNTNNTLGINDTLSIWIKGNKNLLTNLNNSNIYYKYSQNNINAYLIKFEDLDNNTNYLLEIFGEEGDMITIGSLLCNGKENPICQIGLIYEGNNVEYSGFLKRNALEKSCFPRKSLKTEFFKFIDSHNEYIDSYNIIDYFCIKLPENYDELFFSIVGFGYENKKSLGNKLYPIIPGVNHGLTIKRNETVGFYISKINDLYNSISLSFLIYTVLLQTSAKIIECDTYPFCDLNSNNNTNNIALNKFFATYIISYKNDEFYKDWSPVSRNQKILVFKCENSISESENCVINVNIYTEKTKLEIKKMYIQHFLFIREETQNNLSIENRGKGNIITIEILSGSISLFTNDSCSYKYEYKNMHSFSPDNNKKYFNLRITAKKNSVYSIKYHSLNIDNNKTIYFFNYGGNYLFNFYKTDNIILKPDDDYFTLDDKVLPSYFLLYPIECNIELQFIFYNNTLDTYTYSPLKFENGFYQDIFYEEEKEDGSIFVKSLNNQEKCKIFVSTYKLHNSTTDFFNSGIYLQENNSQIFVFNSRYNELKFIYLHANIRENISLTLSLKNEGKYDIHFLINDEHLDKNYSINISQTLIIDNDKWKNICKNIQQICKLSFFIKSEDNKNNSIIELIINEKKESEGKESDAKGNKVDNFKLILGITIPISVIIIFIVIIIIIKYKRKNRVQEEIENLNTKEFLLK